MKKRKFNKKKNYNKNFKKTIIITITFSIIIIIIATIIQLNGQNKITEKCSYLDPWIIDILAFVAALFLIIEGFAKIIKNHNSSIKIQFTRIIRIMFGFSIITLHIIQFLHK